MKFNGVKNYILFIVLLLVSNTSFATNTHNEWADAFKNNSRFTTWQGIEPDKWATLWLIKRHISLDAYFILVPPNSNLPEDAVSFGTPDSDIRRAKQTSMFHQLKTVSELENKSLKYIDQIIFDVEVNIWDSPKHPHSIWFETLYRKLQARYGRDQVPVDCYLAFFDGVEQLSLQDKITSKDYLDQLSLMSLCPGLKENKNVFIEQINHLEVLREISLGKKVVFIDTREDEEFQEVHLPGAKLLRLRDVNAEAVNEYSSADLIVPYCVKDFRGFEVAKSIKQFGTMRVATLSPNGLKGWLKADLPAMKENGMTDEQASIALLRCATEPLTCL